MHKIKAAIAMAFALATNNAHAQTSTSSDGTATAAVPEEFKFCYGYGNLMGDPSKYLQDDWEKVNRFEVGQGNTYLSYIDYFFEGKNHLRMGYQMKNDTNWRDSGWTHGATGVEPKRFNLLD